jgi:hypothetical protein
MRYFFSLIIVSLLIVSCNNNFNRKDANAIVKVGNETLYRSVLEDNIPEGLSPEDSTIAAEHFIRLWINENLLYNIALKNFNDKDNIKQLVDNYRKSLFINQYEEQLINEKLTNEIDEQSLQDYYSQNKDKLKLDHALMKGLFLKVPVNAPQLNEIRIWYKSTSSVSRENLQKLSLNNATVFNYFTDQWMNFDDIMNNFPNEQLTKEDLTVRKKTVEKQDDNFFYFLNITDCLLPGDNAPYEYAKHTIQEILLNQRKIDFLKKTEDDLYQRAIDKGDIQFFNE